ncbi:MAG: hypothetical protein Q8R98_22950 [Rubrivivax sp.]|nr:hypothetical protein [Rubrivivax sp.]MDP3614710.1 hypothetical protein [Rubrivivax sp.]
MRTAIAGTRQAGAGLRALKLLAVATLGLTGQARAQAEAAATPATRTAAPLPAELFYRLPDIQDARLSPSGRWLALCMRQALIDAGRPPEWVEYSDEGHGWYKLENRLDFAARLEAFLARHLKPRGGQGAACGLRQGRASCTFVRRLAAGSRRSGRFGARITTTRGVGIPRMSVCLFRPVHRSVAQAVQKPATSRDLLRRSRGVQA